MKKITLLLLMGMALLSCEKNKTSDCGEKMCTYQFVSVGIRFVNNKGEATEVKDFKVVNQRTGEKLQANSNISINTIKGAFVVVDDGNIQSLSEEGDDLKITGTSVETSQTKSAIIKVSGGKCACHIDKISGTEQIAFD
ncbi:hypothetical protein EZ456_07590 [Pedobacter psychrodurus]|uniref:Lipoprotein n=1 Tax=Pedobacter psychrodurus TaxID=2530456 RepID=A0A4R0PXW4_9SPHI|nr:hypothetical protein [Pedobacter psychrodurus]TCD27802.1 hypothetical protein EZ456_07590 [Pedobacter psychrodurus]